MLLINPSVHSDAQSSAITPFIYNTFPTGLGVLAAYLREYNHITPRILDEQTHPLTDESLEQAIREDKEPMIPPVFQLLCKITREFGMKYIHIPLEPFFFSPCLQDTRHMMCNLNLSKYLLLRWLSRRALMTLKRYDLKWVGWFVGILYTGRMTLNVLNVQ